jgi:hypothetical protein
MAWSTAYGQFSSDTLPVGLVVPERLSKIYMEYIMPVITLQGTITIPAVVDAVRLAAELVPILPVDALLPEPS